MRSNIRKLLTLTLTTASVGLLAAGLAAQSGPIVIMQGLDNPRGLAIGPEGGLYVTEAGRGGSGPCLRSCCRTRRLDALA